MSLEYYFDHNVWRPVELGVQGHGVDVLTAFADGASAKTDGRILDRARELGRVLFTMDEDFLVEASIRRQRGKTFACVVYAHQLQSEIAELIEDLVLIAGVYSYEELERQVIFLPLRSSKSVADASYAK